MTQSGDSVHLVWWLEDHLDDPTVNRKQDALRLIILAYQLLGDDA